MYVLLQVHLTATNPKFQLSSALLALISLISKRRSTSATRYNILILLSAFAVYSYRDLWPLATYTQTPADLEEGGILWVKIALLTFTSIGIPLFVPRRYVPVDPKVCQTSCFCTFD